MQRNVERDRRDLQAYAVGYFKDPEETELSTCVPHSDIAPGRRCQSRRQKPPENETFEACHHQWHRLTRVLTSLVAPHGANHFSHAFHPAQVRGICGRFRERVLVL